MLVLLGAVLFGTAGTARVLAAPEASSVSVGALRVLVGGLVLVVAMPWLGGSRSRTLSLWRRWPVIIMALAAAAFQVSFFAAVASVGVALGTLVAVGSAPILAGLLGWLTLGLRPSIAWAGATALAIVGLALLSADGLGRAGGVGVLLALAAGLSSAVYNVGARNVLDARAAPVELTAACFTLAGAILLPGLLTQPLAWLASPSGIVLALYLGVVTAGLANTWLAHGVRSLGPGPASTLMLADPITAALLGIVFLHETITGSAVGGIGLVLAALALQAAAPRWRRSLAALRPIRSPADQ